MLIGLAIWWWRSSASDPAQEAMAQSLTPEISIASLRITEISQQQINAIGEVVIKNPFPVEMSSSSLEYTVYIDSIKVIEDMYDKPVTIASSDSTVIELPFEIMREPMGEVLQYFKNNNIDSAHYRLDASVVLDVPIEGEEEFSMTLSDTLPAFKLMSVQIADMETNMLSSDEGVDVVLKMTNPNQYPVETRDGSFTFTIKDEMELTGQIEDVVIPAGGTQNVSVHVEKEWGSLTQSAQDFLFNQEDTQYTYTYSGTMYSENKVLDGTELNLRMGGTLNELSSLLGI